MKQAFAKTVVTGILIVGFTSAIAAQSDTAIDARKTALIRQLLEATHAADQAVNVIETELPALRTANPRFPPVFWDRFLTQARARRDEFIAMLVPVYARAFEVSELEELLRFYSSPIGRRLLEIQPAVVRASTQSGQVWAARISADVRQQLEKEGIRIQP